MISNLTQFCKCCLDIILINLAELLYSTTYHKLVSLFPCRQNQKTIYGAHDVLCRAGHTRQLLRQSDTVLRPKECRLSVVTLLLNIVSKINFVYQGKTNLYFRMLTLIYCRYVTRRNVNKIQHAQLWYCQPFIEKNIINSMTCCIF